MGIRTQTSRVWATGNTANVPAHCDAHTSNATHVTKPPRSNRQNLARLEIVVTHTEQRPESNSNRQFLRPSEPLPWIQLQHEGLQLIQRGIFLGRGSLRGMTSRTMIMLLARV
jgi:hypothetical protein